MTPCDFRHDGEAGTLLCGATAALPGVGRAARVHEAQCLRCQGGGEAEVMAELLAHYATTQEATGKGWFWGEPARRPPDPRRCANMLEIVSVGCCGGSRDAYRCGRGTVTARQCLTIDNGRPCREFKDSEE